MPETIVTSRRGIYWVYRILWVSAWINGLVWLFAADHWGWGITSVILQPIAIVYGVGHLMGAW